MILKKKKKKTTITVKNSKICNIFARFYIFKRNVFLLFGIILNNINFFLYLDLITICIVNKWALQILKGSVFVVDTMKPN